MATTVLNSDAVLTSGSVNFNYGVTVGGRVMVGGDFTGQSAAIGTNLNANANGTTVLGVNGNISAPQTSVSYGNVVYGGSNNTPSWSSVSASQGQVSQGTTTASDDFAQAVQISNYLAKQASTGTETISTDGSRVVTLTGSNAGLNIYNISASDLTANQQISIVGGTSAIVNVVGSVNQTYLNFSTGLSASNILFNFVDATTVDLNYNGLPASILAPLADVIVRNSIQGDVVGKTVTANSLTIGGAGYSGDLAGYGTTNLSSVSSVPEPASWLALIGGFGLVGFTIRRGRSRGLPWLAKR